MCGYIFLLYYPGSWVNSFFFLPLSSSFFVFLSFLLRNLLLRAMLLRPLFTGFGFFKIRLPFRILRTIIEQSYVLCPLTLLLGFVLIFIVYLLVFLINGPFPLLFMLIMVSLTLISSYTLMSLFLSCAQNAVPVT